MEWLVEYMGGGVSVDDAQEFADYLTEAGYELPPDETTYLSRGIRNSDDRPITDNEFNQLLNDWYLEYCH